MTSPAMFLIEEAARAYRSDLQSWVGQVQRARDITDALRLAAHKPMPRSVLRPLGAMTSSSRCAAERAVETDLTRRLDAGPPDRGQLPLLMRLSAGHWPAVYRRLEAEMRRKP
jgi:hypothetical protein